MNNISNLEIEELKKIGKYTKENIEKINNHYPIQYLIGYVNFYGYNYYINENTLIPRYETEYLVEKTIKYLKKYNMLESKVLDLCTGSGCIGLTLKKEIPSLDIDLSDISIEALKIANKNKEELNLDVNIIESDLFNNIKDKYNLIVSNPPYVMTNEILPKEVTYEPKIALYSGKKGLDHIEKIFKNIKNYLKEDYLLAFEVNEKSKNDIKILTTKYFEKDLVYFENDLTGRFRYVFIKSKKNE